MILECQRARVLKLFRCIGFRPLFKSFYLVPRPLDPATPFLLKNGKIA